MEALYEPSLRKVRIMVSTSVVPEAGFERMKN